MSTPSAWLRLFLAIIVVLSSTTASAQDVRISEQAKLHFAVGVSLLEDPAGPRYAQAYESFRRAYRASPSPKILSNLGLCAMHIERDGEAIEAYELYLEQVEDIAPDEKARIHSDLKRLHAGVATLVLNLQPVGALIVDERIPETGESIINRYQFDSAAVQIGVRSGKHKVRIEAEGYKPQVFVAELAPSDKQVRKIELVEIENPNKPKPKKKPSSQPGPKPEPQPGPAPAPTDGGGISGASIAMIVVTSALTVGAVVVGVLALQAQADYASYENGGSREDAENVRITGEALNITTDVLIATAAASAVVTVVLLATTSADGASAKLTVAPAVGGGMVGVDVRF